MWLIVACPSCCCHQQHHLSPDAVWTAVAELLKAGKNTHIHITTAPVVQTTVGQGGVGGGGGQGGGGGGEHNLIKP